MEEREEPIPDPPFTGGPYLYVAWPGDLDEILPLNCTSAIREWEQLVDPVATATYAAELFLGAMTVWTEGDRFAVSEHSTALLVRETLNNDRVIAAFQSSSATLRRENRPSAQWALSEIYEGDPGYVQPVVLGLAVIATILMGAGAVGRWLGRKYEESGLELVEGDDELVARFRRSLDQL
jgi:hypothetical protein